MDYRYSENEISEAIPALLEMLKKDHAQNKEIVNTLNFLFPQNDEFDLSIWINSIKDTPRGFILPSSSIPEYVNIMYSKRNDLNSFNYLFRYHNYHPLPTYHIFNYHRGDDKSMLWDKYGSKYFITQDDFLKRIDNLIIPFLKQHGYSTNAKMKVLQKEITENAFLEIDISPKRIGPIPSFSLYAMGDVYLRVGEKRYLIFFNFDFCQLLFLPRKGFEYYFLMQECTLSYDALGRGVSKNNTDEPILYEDENGYFVSNTIEKIEQWNKFICIYIDLSVHYTLLFENWVKDFLLPKYR